MKKLFFLASMVIVVYMESCKSDPEMDEPDGRLSFAFSATSEEGRLTTEDEISFVYFELLNAQNELEIQLLPIFTYNNQYITPGILLPAGEYSLEKFVAMDSEKNVIYGVPVIESELADFVNSPLPLAVFVNSGAQSEIALQVLSVSESEPSDFGLSSFRIKPVCIKQMPVIVTTIEEVSTGILECVLTVEAHDTLYPEEKWIKTYELTSPGSVKMPIGYDQYKIKVEAEGMLPQTKYFRTDFYDGNLNEYEYLDFELIPENSSHVLSLEHEGFKLYVSADPCKLWARLEMPEADVFRVDYIKYYKIGVDSTDKYLGPLYPGGGLIRPKLAFVNFNNLFFDHNYFVSPSYCENYLHEEYRDRLDEVTLEKGLLLDFDHTGNESKLEDYDVHLIKVY